MTPTPFQIFHLFLKAGGLTIGSGYAVVHPLRKALVESTHWMEEEDFNKHLAIAQAMPGIFNVNLAAYLGKQMKGWSGCLAALLGMVLPPFFILILVAQCFDQARNVGAIRSFLLGARPAIIALLILPCIKILRKSNLSLSTIWIPIGAAAAIVLLGISPVYIITGFTFLGVIYAIQVLLHEH